MKVVTIVSAATLLFGVTAASAQMSSPDAGKPGVTKMEKKGSAANSRAHQTRRTLPPQERSTTGSGSETTGSGRSPDIPGVTQGSNPNPSWNRNPDPEVPGNTEE